jgi:hypothetical protein
MKAIFMNWMKGGNAKLKDTNKLPSGHPSHRAAHPTRATHHRPTVVKPKPPLHNHTRHLTIHEGDINIHQAKEDLSTTYRKAKLMQKNRRVTRLGWSQI